MSSGDLRYALRSLRNHPGFTAVAVASLALGIGVNTAIFSLVDQLLLASLPGRDPAHVVRINGGRSGSYPYYREYRDRNQVFSDLMAYSYPQTGGLRPPGAAAVEVGHFEFVTGNLFQGMGIGAAAGRTIAPYDDVKPGGSPVAVLSYAYWQRRLGGDFNVIGKKLSINGQPVEIVGIAERGYNSMTDGYPADVLVPATMFPVITPSAAFVWDTPNMRWMQALGRLRPGVTLEQAQAAMRVLYPQVAAAVSDAAVQAGRRPVRFRQDDVKLESGARPASYARERMADPLRILAIATGLVLLIACANVANLLLSRAVTRRREIAVRLAIGATRGRLVWQLLTESVILAAAGGIGGLVLAYLSVAALGKAELLRSNIEFHPSLAVLACSAAVTALAAMLFGLAPALRATGLSLSDAVKDGGTGTSGGRRMRLTKGLIAVQVAFTLSLVAGAGLFARTLSNLRNADFGFAREKVAIVDLDPSKIGYKGQRLRTFYDQLVERTSRVPGVRSASLATMSPMGSFVMTRDFSAEGYQPKPGERLWAISNPVAPNFFRTLGVPMLLGRDFREEDEPAVTPGENTLSAIGRSGSGSSSDHKMANASSVCIIDEAIAHLAFGDANPLGRHISYGSPYGDSKPLEIIGVVKSVHYTDVRKADNEGTIYEPSWSNGPGPRILAVSTTGDPSAIAGALRREIRALDAGVPMIGLKSMDEYVNTFLQRERLIATLSGFFGVLALALAAVGIYGVTAYAVTQRTREVGIRMALGAQRTDVVRMVVRESALPVALGVPLGLAGAFGLARLASSLLYGVAPADPLVMLVGVAVLAAAAFGAALVPARRASRVDPMKALRYE